MAEVELIMPKMGESIMEATIIGWLKSEGDQVEEDETILEVATDKVDSEVPSPVSGTIEKILVQPDDVVPIGSVIALIKTDSSEGSQPTPTKTSEPSVESKPQQKLEQKESLPSSHKIAQSKQPKAQHKSPKPTANTGEADVEHIPFLSPLVRNIAKSEGISIDELRSISGSGASGRVTKMDLLSYIEQKRNKQYSAPTEIRHATSTVKSEPVQVQQESPKTNVEDANVEIREMDRMRRLIADHMVQSKRTSAHVTSFVEADVTNLVRWRNKVKEEFLSKHGEKLTFTPIFIEAVSAAINEFPMVNSSASGNQILIKKNQNIGIATALASGNLIVPVIKNVQHLSLLGIASRLNELTSKARSNNLNPDEVQGGTFTISNIGTFGNLMGTPIINQPQVAILAIGSINKKAVVIESSKGDTIGIRHMMFLSLSYDHRIVDGMMGGSFLKRIADNLEAFDPNRNI